MKGASPFLGDKEKNMFPAVSRSDVHIEFYYVRPIFCVPDRARK